MNKGLDDVFKVFIGLDIGELEDCLTLVGRLDVETDIHCHVIPGGATTVEAQGNQPSLFSATCEIVKAMALKESAETGWRRKYVEMVCEAVLMELEEDGGNQG